MKASVTSWEDAWLTTPPVSTTSATNAGSAVRDDYGTAYANDDGDSFTVMRSFVLFNHRLFSQIYY